MIIVEDGSGVANANTYVDPAGAYATDYVAGHRYATLWAALDASGKEAVIRQATRTLDALVAWKGQRSKRDQALAWPRRGMVSDGYVLTDSTIPANLKAALMEMAFALAERNRTSDTGTTQGVKKLSLGEGALEIELGEGDPASEPVDMVPPFVLQLLREFGATSTGGFAMAKAYRQ